MLLSMLMTPEPCQILPNGDTKIVSKNMSSCDTIILFTMPLYNEQNNLVYYMDVRGYHALGGIGNTHWPSLFDDVENSSQTLIHVFGGGDNKTAFAMSEIVTRFENALNTYGLNNVRKEMTWRVRDVEMDNKGNIVSINLGV